MVIALENILLLQGNTEKNKTFIRILIFCSPDLKSSKYMKGQSFNECPFKKNYEWNPQRFDQGNQLPGLVFGTSKCNMLKSPHLHKKTSVNQKSKLLKPLLATRFTHAIASWKRKNNKASFYT
jgi:hypothetical protein